MLNVVIALERKSMPRAWLRARLAFVAGVTSFRSAPWRLGGLRRVTRARERDRHNQEGHQAHARTRNTLIGSPTEFWREQARRRGARRHCGEGAGG